MNEFQGKTAVVTGGASGIGLALANRFAEARMNVVLADIEEDALDKAVSEMQSLQHSVSGVVTNTMRRESIENLLTEVTNQFGNVHILCNNAGIAAITSGARGVWEVPDKDWEWTMGVNFYGVLYGIQVFVPHMLAHGEPSHIVNTASLAGLMPGGGPYGVSKHGVLVLSEGLSADLRAANSEIGVSVLCPGFVNTNIHDSERNRPDELAITKGEVPNADFMKSLLEGGKAPEEVASIVFDSIVEDRLYVLPHPAWDDMVRARVDAVLARGGLSDVGFGSIMERRQAGEEL